MESSELQVQKETLIESGDCHIFVWQSLFLIAWVIKQKQMKKIILIISVILSCTAAMSQSAVYKVVKSVIHDYNFRTEDYEQGKSFYPNDMTITRYDNLLIVDDRANSSYKITERLNSSNQDCLNAMGMDEKSNVVGVSFCKSGDYLVITVLYPKLFSVSYYTR